ncbi:Oleosin [Arabidopsis suecica]|uniref:Oleosin n=1 Tax=Arabidopsis suecica TaxID=45249 RepID=A0A8T1Z6F0_ARASU|nr:Oleosin [Arabidopsis suecica]
MFSFLILLLEVYKVVIAVVASIVFFVFSGLTLAGSAVALTVTTPLFIIFSPILVPATIATALLTTGFTAGGALGATAIGLIRRRMGVMSKNNIPATGPTVFAQTPFNLTPKINYEGTFKGSWGGTSSPQAAPNFSYGGTWTATWGGRSFTGKFGDQSGGGSTAGGSTPEAAGAGADAGAAAAAAAGAGAGAGAAGTPAPAPAPPGKAGSKKK